MLAPRLLLPLGLLVWGCAVAQPAAAPTVTAPPAEATATTALAAATATAAPLAETPAGPTEEATAATEGETFEAEVTFGPGPFNLDNPAVGLAGLTSYRATLIVAFAGTSGGQPSAWTKTYVMVTTTDPAARQVTIDRVSDGTALAAEWWVETQGAVFAWVGAQACTADALTEANALAGRLEPGGLLSGVFGADEVGSDPVAGVAANRYTFDERALGQQGRATAAGEVWVAAEGGYVLRYLLTTQGDERYFGDGVAGTLTWDYTLSEINLARAGALPADCPAGMVDAPGLPDAVAGHNGPGLLSVTTGLAPAEALAFYRQALPEVGWLPKTDGVLTEDAAWQDFGRGGQTLSVIISTREGVVAVDLVLVND